MTLLKSKIPAFFAFAAVCLCPPAWALSQKEFMDLCLNGDALQVASALKDEGISVGKADAKGNTPLMMAAQAKGKAADPDKIRLLVNAGSNVNAANKERMRALAAAAQDSDNPEIIVALAAAGAELEERGSRGWTPLGLAAMRNPNPEIAAALIDLGADLAAADNSGATPFMLAARAGNAYEVLITLLDEGADPTVTGANKKTAWSYIESGKKYTPEQLATLKERTQQKNAPAPMTPERFAKLCRRGLARRVGLYLEARTDPNAPVDGLTPLMWAAQYNAHPDVVGVLMKWGARENARDDRGRTALILAASTNGNPKVLSELLVHGARVDYRDVDGKTAFDYAQANPAFAAEDLLLLSSIAASVNEAEERGIQIGAERQKSVGGPADNPRIVPLYKKIADEQNEILRLTTAAVELRKKADLAAQTAENAQKRLQTGRELSEQQKSLIQQLTDNLAELKASQRQELELSRGDIDTLTALWQSEMQKNLKLIEENRLDFQKRKGEIDALAARLQAAEARSNRLAEEKAAAEADFGKERAEAENNLAAVKSHLEEAYRNEVERLNAQIRVGEEKSHQAVQYQSVALSQHRQEVIDLKSRQARLLEENALKYEQQLAELKNRHAKELQEVTLQNEQKLDAKIRETVATMEERQRNALLQEQSRHAVALGERQKRLEEAHEAQISALSRQKDEELHEKMEAALQENSALKKQFDETLVVLNASLRKEREISAALEAELNSQKDKAAQDLAEVQARLDSREKQLHAELNEKLTAQDTQLKAAFEIEKARLETAHRQEMFDAVSKLEAQYNDELNRLRKSRGDELNEKVSALQRAFDVAQAQSRELLDATLAAAETQKRAEAEKEAAATKAGIEQGRQEASRLLETAYAQSLRQAELRYDKMLKEQQTQQQIEFATSSDALNAKHRQEMEQAAARAERDVKSVLARAEQQKMQDVAALRADFARRLAERERELAAQRAAEIEQARNAAARDGEKLIAALKQEYEKRLATLLAQKDAFHAAELKKLEAIQKGALRAAAESHREPEQSVLAQSDQPPTKTN
ncbi:MULTISPECIES: ankyrin repeat domain-containing protein [unclassified Pyramidobacter]|uniref:ankyrin repeat domain-containing protein n=1 Tax=unclassified Pyramidobacter TaxID=2632171 RepID=UPI000EA2C08D|nr:ankyrin repeat domain-containing protein [Pyramidobacter sp. CG50-2]RKJ80666.1 hypothetical protein D7D26_02460 [Pyramidobacter sp. CG50-2]